MRNFKLNVVLIMMLACVVPSNAQGVGVQASRPAAAQTDSLVWYIEELEHDIDLCNIRGSVFADSLQIRLEIMGYELKTARQDARRWYQDSRLWFLAGAFCTALVMGAALHLAF